MSNNLTDPIVQAELAPGEHLLWSGQPRQGLVLHVSDAFFIPFGLFWVAMFGGLFIETLTEPNIGFMALFFVPFFLGGLFFAFGRFALDAWQRRRTYYGVT